MMNPCIVSVSCLLSLIDLDSQVLCLILFIRIKYGWWSGKHLISIPDVVSNIVSANWQKKLSMIVAWLFDNLVESVIFG